MLGGIKDSLASTAARSLLTAKIERYGRITDLRIRSKERRIDAELLLDGEELPITVRVNKYRVIAQPGGGHALCIERIAASRPWLQHILEDFVVEKPIPIPSIALLALGGCD